MLAGCTMDCVEPGLESRNTSVTVDVPLQKTDEGSKINWMNSGQVISNGEKIKFSINGSIDFCPYESHSEVLVPASFCADGSVPDYSKAKNVNAVPDNYGINENALCGNQGFGGSRRYVDTKIKVNPGDKLSFDLVPREVKIDYDNPEGKGITFDDNCYTAKTGGKKVTAEEIINGGEFFCGDQNVGREKVEFKSMKKIDSPQNETAAKPTVLVGNGYTPYDNKVHFDKDYIARDIPWINGALLDLRRIKVGLDELCSKKDCASEEKKYSSYELNCYRQKVCYNSQGIWNGNGESCISSIRYKKYDKGGKCDMYSHLREIKDHLDSSSSNISIVDDAWAEALVAKIGDPYSGYLDIQENKCNYILHNIKGVQCLPNDEGAAGDSVCAKIKGDFENFSLRLNHDYIVNSKVKPGSNVMLGIAYNGASGFKRGGYHVKVNRSCEYTGGEKLYVYLGDKPPEDHTLTVESDDFKKVLKLTKVKEDNIDYYIIDGSHLNNGESKEIYFGIDVSNIKQNDITDRDGKYHENNKYSVTLFVKKKINDFISSTINKIFNLVTEGRESSVETAYEGYRKGLFQAVRALLTLYIVFTVFGYMLGTVQLSKFDFVVRMMKVAFVAFAFSERSWELGTMLSEFFVDGSSSLVDVFSGYIGEGNRKFAFLDLTAGVLFTGETWLKFLSLALAGPFGFLAFLMILKATFMFIKCVISATFKYVISSLLVAFLLSLAPLFITFILFQQTKPLFDGWIKAIAHIGIQPVILFSSLSLLNQLMYSVLYNLTNFSACYQCLISAKFLSYDVCLLKSILPLGYSASTGVDVALSSGERAGGYFAALPIDLVQAFIYLILAKAMEAFVSISETMAQAIFKSGYGVVGGVSAVARNASQSILSTVGLDNKTQGMIKRIKKDMAKERAKVELKSKKSDEKPKQPNNKNNSEESAKKGSDGGESRTQEQRRGSVDSRSDDSGSEAGKTRSTSSSLDDSDSEIMEDTRGASARPEISERQGNSDEGDENEGSGK